MDRPEGAKLSVCVVYSPQARTVMERQLCLPGGASVADAIHSSGMPEVWEALKNHPGCLGVWGRKAHPDQALKDGDRVEVYRPLRVDPKVARRERFQKQGARTAGLFAKRRDNAKSGY
jgi:putative ubiquitin-RnfH superfamily antitoxin RatB of RatAB toxin-antitoxin module